MENIQNLRKIILLIKFLQSNFSLLFSTILQIFIRLRYFNAIKEINKATNSINFIKIR